MLVFADSVLGLVGWWVGGLCSWSRCWSTITFALVYFCLHLVKSHSLEFGSHASCYICVFENKDLSELEICLEKEGCDFISCTNLHLSICPNNQIYALCMLQVQVEGLLFLNNVLPSFTFISVGPPQNGQGEALLRLWISWQRTVKRRTGRWPEKGHRGEKGQMC